MNTAHSIGTLIAELNSKAQAAGCDVRAEPHTLDRTWGDLEGIAITGSGDHARAVAFAEAYYRKHLASKRGYDSQWAFHEGREIEAVRRGPKDQIFNVCHLLKTDLERARAAGETFKATTVGLVYYPCNE